MFLKTAFSHEPFTATHYRRLDDVLFRETAFSEVTDSETILSVEACGICGTDINAILNGSNDYVQVGHEIAGRAYDSQGTLTNRTVVLESSSACGCCASCRNGRPDLCLDVKSFFRKPYFGLADRMLSPTLSVLDYSGMDPAVASLSEPLASKGAVNNS